MPARHLNTTRRGGFVFVPPTAQPECHNTDLHAVEVLWVLHNHAVRQDEQIPNVTRLAGVVRGERGGVAHRSQQGYGTGEREVGGERRGKEGKREKKRKIGSKEGGEEEQRSWRGEERGDQQRSSAKRGKEEKRRREKEGVEGEQIGKMTAQKKGWHAVDGNESAAGKRSMSPDHATGGRWRGVEERK